jgi:hypothetical protein
VINSLPRITHVRTLLVTALLAVALALGRAGSAGAATYYVDNQSPAASSTGPGTEAQPYSTITAAIAAHRGAGITILVKPGIYREQVQITASGTSDAPFVIKATGPGVVIDGADLMQNQALWSQPDAAPLPVDNSRPTPADRDLGVDPQTLAQDYGWLGVTVTWPVQQVFVNERRLQEMFGPATALITNSFTWNVDDGFT